ncbi:MAG: tetratricopeptide repeat protein, partial [Phycisphaerales bacterium]|nr:tetratricopeptide repeat protein [Phycisphaerales bacterium]
QICAATDRPDEAIAEYRMALAIFSATRPATDIHIIQLRIGIGRLLEAIGRYDEATPTLLLAYEGAAASGRAEIPHEDLLTSLIEAALLRDAPEPPGDGQSPQSVAATGNTQADPD